MRFKLGCDATSIHNDFVVVYGHQAPSYSTITKWIREFKGGRTNVEDNPRSGAPITGLTEANIEVCIFFRTRGVETLTYWGKGNTIDQHSYVDDCLKPLVKVINQHRTTCGTKNLKFHHDNARPHVAKKVIDYLNDQNFLIMDHPPYSPDLAPSDFWLFDYVKQRIDDHTSAESLVKQITKIVNDIPKEEWQKTFNKWIERMELCIKNKGDYFEHLIKN